MTDFFLLGSEPSALVAQFDESQAPPRCPVCGRLPGDDPAAGYVPRLKPSAPRLDLMHADPLYVASDAFATYCREKGLEGFELRPVEGLEEGLMRAVPAGTARVHSSSDVQVADECDHCGFRDVMVGGPWRIDEDAWDGSTFFHVEERPVVTFCTGEAMAALQESGLTGPIFIDLDVVVI